MFFSKNETKKNEKNIKIDREKEREKDNRVVI